MTIEELRAERRTLAKDIANLVKTFEERTSVQVEGVVVERSPALPAAHEAGLRCVLSGVSVRLKLE